MVHESRKENLIVCGGHTFSMYICPSQHQGVVEEVEVL